MGFADEMREMGSNTEEFGSVSFGRSAKRIFDDKRSDKRKVFSHKKKRDDDLPRYTCHELGMK